MTNPKSDFDKPKRKSVAFIILGVTVALVVVTLLLGLIFEKRIKLYLVEKFSPRAIELHAETRGKTDAKIYFKFRNGLIPGFVDSVRYLLKLDADTIGEGVKILGDDKSSEDSLFILKLEIDQKRYLKRLRNSKGENAKLHLSAKIYLLDKLLGGQPIIIEKETDLALPIQPELKIDRVEFLKFGLKKSQMMLHISLKNHNKYRAEIASMKYILKVKDYMKAEGKTSNSIWINSKQTTVTTIPVEVDLFHLSKLIKTILKNETKIPFNLAIKVSLNLVDSPMDTLNLNSYILGELDLRKLIQKKKEKKAN